MKRSFNYIAITNNPVQARSLVECGIQQIMVDTEILGKDERQGHRDTVISAHSLEDVSKIKRLNLEAEIICRINPYHLLIHEEIDIAVENGADKIMVPMITSFEEYKDIVEMINSRAEIIPLIETPYSFFKVHEILDYTSLNQIHFGLNDLCISLGMKNIFEVLLSVIFQDIFRAINTKSLRLGIGGIGNPQVIQNVSPALLLNHYIKCEANSVILSRNFFSEGYEKDYINQSLQKFEETIKRGYDPSLEDELIRQINEI